MNALTNSQIQRQDFVDNAIYELLNAVNPSNHQIIWNIEAVGDIRDLIQHWFVERFAITDEMTFYPYVDTNEQS